MENPSVRACPSDVWDYPHALTSSCQSIVVGRGARDNLQSYRFKRAARCYRQLSHAVQRYCFLIDKLAKTALIVIKDVIVRCFSTVRIYETLLK